MLSEIPIIYTGDKQENHPVPTVQKHHVATALQYFTSIAKHRRQTFSKIHETLAA